MPCPRRLAVVLGVTAALATSSRAQAGEPGPRRWRLLADTLIGVRSHPAGLTDVSYRLALVAGLLSPAVDVVLALDRQVGGDDRIASSDGALAAHREWIGSLRVGRRVAVASDLWLSIAGGPALVHTRMESRPRMAAFTRVDAGLDAAAALVWRSDPVIATLAIGATAIPFAEDMTLDGARVAVPARVQTWAGLGIGLVL